MMGALAHDHPATEPQHDESPDDLRAPRLCTHRLSVRFRHVQSGWVNAPPRAVYYTPPGRVET